MMPVVLHVNNLKQMDRKWPAGEQTRCWVAAEGILLMDQPEAFLKFIEARHPVISMLASQEAIAGVGNGVEGSTKEEEDFGHQQSLYRDSGNNMDAIIFIETPEIVVTS
jgi:hypothetical protein